MKNLKSLIPLLAVIILSACDNKKEMIYTNPQLAGDWQNEETNAKFNAATEKATDPCKGLNLQVDSNGKKSIDLDVQRIMYTGGFLMELEPFSEKVKTSEFTNIGIIDIFGTVEFNDAGVKSIQSKASAADANVTVDSVSNAKATLVDPNTLTFASSMSTTIAGKPGNTLNGDETLVRITDIELTQMRQQALECIKKAPGTPTAPSFSSN